jgi:hypothetical protein
LPMPSSSATTFAAYFLRFVVVILLTRDTYSVGGLDGRACRAL